MSPRHPCQAAGLPRAALRPSVRAVRHGLLAMLLSAAPFAITPLQAADSAAVSRSYSVAPGSLAAALASFAEQAGVSVAVSPELAAGKRSAGLQGQWPVAEGLQRLLDGSGLEAAPSGEGVYVIRPLSGAGAVELGTTSIIGREQSATGPVDGYLAERSASGTKTDTPLIKTPQSVSVVTRDQMDDQAVTSVAQALRYSGGTFADYRGSSHRVDEVYVRGFGYAPTYLDGLTVGGESYTQVDPWFLERVELIHGPASVLYGQANPGGLLAMTSKRPSTEAKNRVQFGVGSDSLRRGAFDLNGQLDEQGTLLYRLNGLLSKGQAEVDHIDEERQALAPSLTWQPNEDTSLTLLAYYQNDPDAGYRNFWPTDGVANSGPHGRISRHLNVGDPDFYQSEREQSSIGYLFEHRFNELLTFRQNLRYLKENERFKQLVFMSMVDDRTMRRVPADSRAELEQAVVDNQLQFDFATGPLSHTLLTGVDYKRSHRDATDARDYNGTYLLDAYDPQYGADVGPLSPSSDSTQRADQIGFYLQDQIEYGNWNLLLGGRQDRARSRTDDNLSGTRESQRDEEFTGRAGLLYAFDSGFSPYISYSTSFEPVLSTPEPGEPAFEPTTGEQTEIGLKYQPPGSEAMFSVALFDLTQQNVVTYDGGWYPTQTGEIQSKGIELEARGNLTDNLELVGAYTHLEPEVTKTTRPGVEGKEPPRTPAHLASLWATYQFDGSLLPGVSAGAGVRYVGSSFGDQDNSYKVDSVVLLDAMLGYDLGRLAADLDGASVQLNASNLTDKVYAASCAAVDTCFYGASRTVTASVNYAW
ncbi:MULTISPECIES: TonB-dependent siderophore receptor [unclassified Pseudomonas]|uniref:TonB-dependent siderophore receptor n=1 Tax=unclassified Pseudomonas TaxID=196821 RepID=UPI00244940AD|nr:MULTISPECIES: TonB-dependent siderophore receptor [unclassified Pseudomonas]MDG9925062.1 TonB-dependent siderophore receptor [Pseudomonas sp. GD04045]MDH0037063.1 TonB-dependent siderophore receptor [Pseudomonas sp. GD04019]